jgi:hypothetical protein
VKFKTTSRGAATSSKVGSLRPGDPQISWPPPTAFFDMPKTPDCPSEQIGVVRPALFALSRHPAFLRLNNNFGLFNPHSNDLVGNTRILIEAS